MWRKKLTGMQKEIVMLLICWKKFFSIWFLNEPLLEQCWESWEENMCTYKNLCNTKRKANGHICLQRLIHILWTQDQTHPLHAYAHYCSTKHTIRTFPASDHTLELHFSTFSNNLSIPMPFSQLQLLAKLLPSSHFN